MKNKTSISHYEKYKEMARRKGVEFSGKNYMFRTRKQWKKLYHKDKHLNNVPLKEFDVLYCLTGNGISFAENCCMHKHVIIYQVIGCTPEFEDK